MTTDIEIQRLGMMGQGVGYDPQGNIYFVVGGVPGDKVRVEFEEERKRYRDARLVEILQPSSNRTEAACAYFQKCGGCDWLHMDYETQVRGKEGILKHVFERGGLTPREFVPMAAAEKVFGYRNRIQLRQVDKKIGFFKKRSHDIVDVETCRVADPKLNEEISKLREEPSPEKMTKVELFVRADGTVGRTLNAPHAHSGFQQVNTSQNEVLRKAVAQSVGRAGSVLELFCGEGNLTFAYAANVDKVIAIDSGTAALEKAKAHLNEERSKVAFLSLEINSMLLRKLPTEFRDQYDTLVLDPPRQGVGLDLTHWVHPRLRKIVYISCSPVTFSKDVQGLSKAGFSFDSVRPVDMFPHTRHIEFVAVFSRSSS